MTTFAKVEYSSVTPETEYSAATEHVQVLTLLTIRREDPENTKEATAGGREHPPPKRIPRRRPTLSPKARKKCRTRPARSTRSFPHVDLGRRRATPGYLRRPQLRAHPVSTATSHRNPISSTRHGSPSCGRGCSVARMPQCTPATP